MNSPKPPTELWQNTNLLYHALLAGQLILALIVVTILGRSPEESIVNTTYLMIAALLTFSNFGLAFFINNKRLKESKSLAGLSEKLSHFRQTVILRSALIEGANLATIALMFLSQAGQLYFLLLFAVGIAGFLFFRPNIKTFARDYQLSREEENALLLK